MNIPFFRKVSVTQKFIDEYCYVNRTYRYTTRDKELIEKDWQMMWKALQHPEIELDKIAYCLTHMNYNEKFQLTPYWQICRNKVAKDHEFRCNLNHSHDNRKLEVHHPSYDFRGYEAQNLDKLVPLCKSCHQGISDKNKEEELRNIELQNNNQYIIKNPDLIVDSINNRAEVLRKVNFGTLEVIRPLEIEEPMEVSSQVVSESIELLDINEEVNAEVLMIVEPQTITADTDPLFYIKNANNTLSKLLERLK